MKKCLYFIFVFLILISLSLFNSPKTFADNCEWEHGAMTLNGTLPNNSAVQVSCPASTTQPGCPGYSKELTQADNYSFDNSQVSSDVVQQYGGFGCDCNVNAGPGGGCIKIDVPNGCTVDTVAACGNNQQSIDQSFTVTCQPPPTTSESPTPSLPVTTPSPTPEITPTPPLVCNQGCVTDTQCGGGMICNNGVCRNPYCVSSETCVCEQSTPTPTETPPPTITLPPGSTPTPTIPVTTITPPVTITVAPTPTVAPATCTCDGLTATGLFSGAQSTLTAYGIVKGADPTQKTIPSIDFQILSGNDPSHLLLLKDSGPIGTGNAGTNRYSASYNYLFPTNIPPNTNVTVAANISCQSTVLGAQTVAEPSASQPNIFQRILSFFAGIFEKKEAPAATSVAFQFAPTQAEPQQTIQLKTKGTATLLSTEKDRNTCRFIFRFNN